MKSSKNTTKIPIEEIQNSSLYAKRKKIYPRIVLGYFTKLKTLSGLILLGLYYGLPWLQWNGHQAILFDLPARKFHIFGMTFWPQDFIYLTFLLILAAMILFFFTALAGRLWCGFACPQTIWTDAFLWMERLIEGDRPKQIKLDNEPKSFKKFRIKTTKHTLWIIFALFTGFTFVGYFTPINELTHSLMNWQLSGWETFWVLFYGLATYGNAGRLREQVCTYMCPYARFQSAMFDNNTMIIAYDEKRGESRGSRKKSQDNYKDQGLGDCIDCSICVQVCPTGIDIRDGLQYQCISCSACIDACDEVMDKMAYPRGLIRYTTENNLKGNKTRIFRPRIFVYAGILIALLIGAIYSISTRSLVELDVIRDRQSLYIETDAGMIENIYSLRIMNLDNKDHSYNLNTTGIEDLALVKNIDIKAKSGEISTVAIRLMVAKEKLQKRTTAIHFTLTATDNPELTITEEARFLGPLRFR